MKRLVSLLLTISLLLSLLPTASIAECSHKNLSFEYDPQYSYEAIDDVYHSVTIDLYYKCDDCGERVRETQQGNNAKHRFNSRGVCEACGYEEETEAECSHKNLSLEYDPQYSYEELNDTYHSVITDLYYKCDDCGERIHETEKGGKAKHRFNSRGVCKDCGYEEEVEEDCSHKNLSLEYDPQYSYEAIDDVYHSVTVDLYYKCDDCGERVHKTQDSGSVKHHFEYGECVQCHYKELWTEAPILEPTPRPSLMPIETDIPQPTEVVTPVPTVIPTEVVTPVPTRVPTAVPTEVVTLAPTRVPTAIPTEVVTPAPTKVPTAVPTQVITPAPTNTVAPKPTEIATIEPTATVHVCKAGKPSHWYGVYEYYDENSHTRHHVTTTYCTVCGKELSKTNELEYVEHVFENDTCTKCGATDEAAVAEEEFKKLLEIINVLLEKYHNGQITSSDFLSYAAKAHEKAEEYKMVIKGEKRLSEIVSWQESKELMRVWENRNNKSYTYIENSTDTIINLEKPDNKWYYFTTEDGEQILFGNFTDKVTIKGTIGQIIVGEIPVVGTAADIRDIVADFKNWKWTWGHAGTTLLDMIGILPVVGTLKYSDEVAVAIKGGRKLSDSAGEILTATLKKLDKVDEVADAAKHSDEIAEGVAGALLKNADELGTVAKTTIKTFDDLKAAVKNITSYADNALEHIFKGNRTGGFHYEGLEDAAGKVVQITKAPNAQGVYEATVEIAGKGKNVRSTFFPKSWTPEQVLDAIEEVFSNGKYNAAKNIKTGMVNGVKIRINLDGFGRIVSAFPLME